MAILNFILLYVAEPSRSADFYSTLLACQPVENSPNFAMFVLPNGVKLGLWRRNDVSPAAEGLPGSSEIVLSAGDSEEVDTLFAAWAGKGWAIAQHPTQMDFGYTFVVRDPDGHRVRVYTLSDTPR